MACSVWVSGKKRSVQRRTYLGRLDESATEVMHTALEHRMRQAEVLRNMTVAEFLAHMRKIKVVTTRTGRRVLLEIAKRNRELLARIGIPLPQ